MRTEYEFIGESGQRLRVAESSSTGLDAWCEKDDFPAGWETANVDLDAGAFLDAAAELLKLARVIDACDDLVSEIVCEMGPESLAWIKETRQYAQLKKLLGGSGEEP